jgi:hypothetical protein
MRPQRIRRWPFAVLCLFVCAAATALSWFCGGMATLLYGTICSSNPPVQTGGPILGIVGGALGSIGWCVLVVVVALRYLRRTGRASPKLIAWGTFAGHAAALLAAGVVHGGLMVLDGQWRTEGFIWGMGTSAVTGLGLGLICAFLAWGAAALANPAWRQGATPPRPPLHPMTPPKGTDR